MAKIPIEYDVVSICPAAGYQAGYWDYPEGWPDQHEKPVLRAVPVIVWAAVRYREQDARHNTGSAVVGIVVDEDGLDTPEYLNQFLGYQRDGEDIEEFRPGAEQALQAMLDEWAVRAAREKVATA